MSNRKMQIKIKRLRMINLQYSAPLVSLTYDRGITRCHDGQVHLWSIASNMENVLMQQSSHMCNCEMCVKLTRFGHLNLVDS